MPVDSIGPATTRTTRGAIWPVSTELSRCITSGRMAFPEYERFLQRYEAALRHWAQVIWSSRADVLGIPEEMKQRAYVERNEAYERMRAHNRVARRVSR